MAWPPPGARRVGTYLSHSYPRAFPGCVVQDRACSVHAGATFGAGLCAVKVKLTIGLAATGGLILSIAFHVAGLISSGEEPKASNRLAVRGRGGDFSKSRARQDQRPKREGFLRALPFSCRGRAIRAGDGRALGG